jgi:hypothetical protein
MDSPDANAIKEIIDRQFASLNWSPGATADWNAFISDFASDASLYPSARPAKHQTPEEFVARMKGLAAGSLRSFAESALGYDIRVFGNVAVAVTACQMTENETEMSRSVEMMLLVKTDGRWRIVSQAWDTERAAGAIPDEFLRTS